MSVNTDFIVGGTAGSRRSTVVGISTKGKERHIAVLFVTATVVAAQRNTEKLVFAVSTHRLHNSCGPPSPLSDRPSRQMRRSATSIPSSPR